MSCEDPDFYSQASGRNDIEWAASYCFALSARTPQEQSLTRHEDDEDYRACRNGAAMWTSVTLSTEEEGTYAEVVAPQIEISPQITPSDDKVT